MSYESDALHQQTEALDYIHNRLVDIVDTLRCPKLNQPVTLIEINEGCYVNPLTVQNIYFTHFNKNVCSKHRINFCFTTGDETRSRNFNSKLEALQFLSTYFHVPNLTPPTQEN